METVFSIFEIVTLAICGYIAWTGVRMFLTARMLHGDTITHREVLPQEPLPEALRDIETKIHDLGFVFNRLISYRVNYAPQQTHRSWTYAHPDYSFELEIGQVAAQPPFTIVLQSLFTDGAFLLTWYPRGFFVETPDFAAHHAKHTLENALDYHRREHARWETQHGAALPSPDDDDTLMAVNHDIALRHGTAMYAAYRRNLIGAGITRLGLALCAAIFGLILQGGNPTFFVESDYFWRYAVFALIGLAVLLIFAGRRYATRGVKPALDADTVPPVDPKIHPLHRPERRT